MSVVVWIVFGLALLPASMTIWNLFLFMPLRKTGRRPAQIVSVLIPARNEASTIADVVGDVLASKGVDFEVIVLDDDSTDQTAAIVRGMAIRDTRVRLETAPPLPPGWCGKQHACHILAHHAKYPTLCWIDADVRLSPDALRRMANRLEAGEETLITGFPRQRTVTWAEKLVVPLIHVVLMGYLPIAFMRRFRSPGFGAGCGQLVMAQSQAYHRVGGHAAIRASLHDGINLPRVFREADQMTDTFDAGDIASCRMYHNAAQVWRGFAKNAVEGMATPIGIWVWTVLLLGGFVAPWLMVGLWAGGMLGETQHWQRVVLWGAWVMTSSTSLGLMFRFQQTWLAGLARPVGVLMLVAIQWYAMARKLLGLTSSWRGRVAPQ